MVTLRNHFSMVGYILVLLENGLWVCVCVEKTCGGRKL